MSIDELKKALLIVTMPDGSKWSVPVEIIAKNRAQYYADERDFGSLDESLDENTWPLFTVNHYEIAEWAANEMDWEDVSAHAVKRVNPASLDYQDGWVNGDKEIVKA